MKVPPVRRGFSDQACLEHLRCVNVGAQRRGRVQIALAADHLRQGGWLEFFAGRGEIVAGDAELVLLDQDVRLVDRHQEGFGFDGVLGGEFCRAVGRQGRDRAADDVQQIHHLVHHGVFRCEFGVHVGQCRKMAVHWTGRRQHREHPVVVPHLHLDGVKFVPGAGA